MSGNPKITLRIRTNSGDVVNETKEIDSDIVAVPDSWLTYYTNADQLAIDEKTGQLVMAVFENYNCPIQVFKDRPGTEPGDIEQFASEKIDEAAAKNDTYTQKNSLLTWFVIIALVLLLIITIFVYVKL